MRKLSNTVESQVDRGLRTRLESARLEILALLRAIDSLMLVQELPDELQVILELDADFAEALMVLGHPVGTYNLASIVRDTLSSLDNLPTAHQNLLAILSPAERKQLAARVPVVYATLRRQDSYHQIPGGGPP